MPDWNNYEHRRSSSPHWVHERHVWDTCCGETPRHKRVDGKYDVYCQCCGDSIVAYHAAEAMTKWNLHKRSQHKKHHSPHNKFMSLPVNH